jgi:hypothetical protein
MSTKQKSILAFSLLVLWAGLAVWQWRLLEESVRVPLENVTGLASSGQEVKGKGTGLRVHLDRLTSLGVQRDATFTAPRNIFARSSSDGTLPLRHDGTSMDQQGSVSAEHVMDEGDVGHYRYLGFLRVGKSRQNTGELAVLSKDDEVLVLKSGDRVSDHLVLKAITAESVIMRDLGTHKDQTVLLSEEPVGQEQQQE